ncbi:MAG: 16S rRNA (cytosine(1402)-N(4))-methyltransferase RsmH [bacterium]|nr:16S rRNA (cytosine(1402)-N(4))-methyltransferase RsmH [bacterium]
MEETENIDNIKNPAYAHIPVLWREIVEYVETSQFKGTGCFVDCTLGEGGHSELLLKRFENLRIIAFERDSSILEVAKKRLEPFKDRIEFVNDNFSEAFECLEERGQHVEYLLYDFGISSFHFDKSGRGFAFKEDEPLDMRLTPEQELDAWYVVNHYKEERLTEIFYRYGEENWAKRIALVICERRQKETIETTGDLATIVLAAIPNKMQVKNIHPATRVFQALRIEVNDELGSIEKALENSYKCLTPGGRMMAISFHSLEDRIVKNRFRKLSRGCTCENEPKHCQCRQTPLVRLITRKPIIPGEDEIELNKRARSSKLRVCDRV